MSLQLRQSPVGEGADSWMLVSLISPDNGNIQIIDAVERTTKGLNPVDIFSQLAQRTPFSSLTKEELIDVMNLAISRKFQKGEFVTHCEDVWPYLLFVHTGEFHALKESGKGRSFVIEGFYLGDIFWGLALFENEKPNPMAIQAAMNGQLFLWHKDQIERIISDNPQFVWGLFGLLAKKMERASEIVEEMVFRPLPGRLANLLLDQFGDAVDNFVSRDLTLDEMAARIGSTREMVCKILYQFSGKGIIDIHRTELKINDRDGLQDIADRMKG
jgi:CRP-like cAMP-binding protein